ncbi:MAG: hypothetical protein BWZ02_03026 [Lentisphaerae bacterium ADurb.BinA184]|nr:MAG: hypothetical protein BWZ02_03026 [Lentisphaerae bacterium ADurb.BinA184]
MKRSTQSGAPLVIHRLSDAGPVRFAAAELARYLRRMTGRPVRQTRAARYRPRRPGLWLAVVPPAGVPGADGGSLDDGIAIRARPGHVRLQGRNPRSVLFAVYRYLEELGCRWLRPGPFGERVPNLASPLARRFTRRETPTSRHRCICIEGACSPRHVRDMIDYAARRGFNAYFLQFRNAYTFFDRWHSQEDRAGRSRTRLTQAGADRRREAAKREALRRGLLIHAVGHGWTCEPFGIPGIEWAPYTSAIPAEATASFAEIAGRRELWHGVPLNTNLCYSTASVRARMADAVADYAAAHPDEAVLHVWLADGSNNQCECRACRQALPSDWYVRILNEIDHRLTARRLSARIVFLAYVDLLWAPEKERLDSPGRFILMFAPITRSYARAFLEGGGPAEPPRPYERNRLVFPRSPAANVAMLRQWQASFRGDAVDFDYHLWGEQHFHPDQLSLARVLCQDIRDLPRLGLNGLIACAVQRAAFPTNLWWDLAGRMLWNRRQGYNRLVVNHLCDLYGPRDGTAVHAWLRRLGHLLRPADLARALDPSAAGPRTLCLRAARRLDRVPAAAAALRPVIRRNARAADPVTRAAWRLLDHHAWYVQAFAAFHAAALRRQPDADPLLQDLLRGLRQRHRDLHPVLDVWMCAQRLRQTRAALQP